MKYLKGIALISTTFLFLSTAFAGKNESVSNWSELKSDKLWKGKNGILGNAPRVAIPSIRVAFETTTVGAKQDKAKNIGELGKGSYKRDANFYYCDLGGLNPIDYQKIANQVYDDLVANLKKAGVDVATLDEMKATEGFKALETEAYTLDKLYTNNEGTSKYTILAPEKLPLFFLNAETIGNKGPFALGNQRACNKMSAELKALIVIPTIAVDFATFDLKDKREKLRRFTSFEVQPNLRVNNNVTRIVMVFGKNAMAGDAFPFVLTSSLAITNDFANKVPPPAEPGKGFINNKSSVEVADGILEVNAEKYSAGYLRAASFLSETFAELIKKNQK